MNASQPDSGQHLPHQDDHHRGLAFDVGTLMARRRALQVIGGGALVALVGCAKTGSDATTATTAATTATNAAGAAATGGGSADGVIPEETAGPYPGDGSNGPDVLSQSGIVRKDITTSIGDASGRGGLRIADLDTDPRCDRRAVGRLRRCGSRDGRRPSTPRIAPHQSNLTKRCVADVQGRRPVRPPRW